MGSSIPFWQGLSLSFIGGWVLFSSLLSLTPRLRSLTQPWVTRRVLSDTPLILRIQSKHHAFLDGFFSVLSCIVSVPFYTGFIPLLFWSGHSKLGRQIAILMAFCDYIGNSLKDLVSAPRPSCPPARRVTATEDEKENAMEYGLPSSHALNTVCLSGYLLHYFLMQNSERDVATVVVVVGFALVFLLVMLIAIGRIYLGMHSLTDVVAGISIGLVVLGFWLTVHGSVDDFIVNGQNVTSFWASLSFLLCFAYPTPEVPTPSFDYHTAFNGVTFGIVSGVQQTYLHFHHENIPRIFSPQLSLPVFLGRMLIGIPTILIVKFCSKAIAKWLLPMLCNTLSIPITSSGYVPTLRGNDSSSSKGKGKANRQFGSYFHKVVDFFPQQKYDVDTGIRFLQYAGLAWSVVDLVPSLFARLSL